MRRKNKTTLGLLLTAAVLVAHLLLPEKRLVLHPEGDVGFEIYGYTDAERGESWQWLDEQSELWRCQYLESHSHGCGWQMVWHPAQHQGLDLRGYDAMELIMDYQGPARRLRVLLRNYDPNHADIDNLHTNKYMSTTFPVEETAQPVRLALGEFSVATWWFREFNIQRKWAMPEFDHITTIGVEVVEPGDHSVRIAQLTLIGRWIATKTLLSAVLIFWLSVFLYQGLIRFTALYRRSQRERLLIKSLNDKQKKLQVENKGLEALADTDPLTGVLNRSGITRHIDTLFGPQGAGRECGIILLDLDHFKALNDSYGHDMGDKVLKAFATIVAANLRSDDIFARWGGEEFVLLCQNNSAHSLLGFADKLRTIAASCSFGADLNLHIAISAGLTIARAGESFDTAFKRADQALYKAKQSGRNRVEYADHHED